MDCMDCPGHNTIRTLRPKSLCPFPLGTTGSAGRMATEQAGAPGATAQARSEVSDIEDRDIVRIAASQSRKEPKIL